MSFIQQHSIIPTTVSSFNTQSQSGQKEEIVGHQPPLIQSSKIQPLTSIPPQPPHQNLFSAPPLPISSHSPLSSPSFLNSVPYNKQSTQNTVENSLQQNLTKTQLKDKTNPLPPRLQLRKTSSACNSLSCNFDPQETLPARFSEVTADKRSVHQGIECDRCRCLPIVGPRYKCKECEDFDLCEVCFHLREHGHKEFEVRLMSRREKETTRAAGGNQNQNMGVQYQQTSQQNPPYHTQPQQAPSFFQEMVSQFSNLFRS